MLDVFAHHFPPVGMRCWKLADLRICPGVQVAVVDENGQDRRENSIVDAR